MTPYRATLTLPPLLRLLTALAVILSISLIAAEDFVADHCGQECSSAPLEAGHESCDCLCCFPVGKMIAVIEPGGFDLAPPVSWAARSSSVPVEVGLAACIDHPPQNSL